MNAVWRVFGEVGPAVVVVVPLLLLAASLIGAVMMRLSPAVVRVLAAAVVCLALVLVLVMTMRPAAGGLGVRVAPVLDPTVALEGLLRPSYARRTLRLEALGNLLLLMPLGAALPFLVGWRAAALLVPAVAVAAEVAQWAMATGRTADVLDIVLNTAGGLVGVLIAVLALRLAGPRPTGPSGPAPAALREPARTA